MMLVMGISGGVFRTHEDGSAYINRFAFHDAAAVLIDDGEVVAAIEQERLNRIKHTNKIPLEAMRSCLHSYGARIQDLDYIAYYSEEAHMNSFLGGVNLRRTLNNEEFEDCWDFRILLRNIIQSEHGYTLPLERLQFVNHHLAHALSAFLPSGFDRSLVFTIDGQGDDESGRVLVGEGSDDGAS